MRHVDSREMRFEFDDVPGWKGQLESKGYAVIRAVASKPEVEEIKSLLWTDLEHMCNGLQRSQPETWHLLNDFAFGICPDLAQSRGQWHLRGIPRIKTVFERIWKTNDLLVSMDAVLIRKR
eukprot:TRINITY_DN60441_c0_g1_i1.p1 TRINITY_DN60441_c0_g1~~TRINITY_DN60441_c0_g1_i1.p1  ORF type:complete len:121 (-),score=0.71 TRINITY_DN60441_c0_g1_i1:9-371(-)